MVHFLSRFFKKEKKSVKKQNILDQIKRSNILTSSIKNQKEELNNIKYDHITENDEEYFIPLTKFLTMMSKEGIEIDDIIEFCKHISEIKPDKFSTVDVYSISGKNCIVLYMNQEDCFKESGQKGDKVSLVTWRNS